jgi:hypothetical protein
MRGSREGWIKCESLHTIMKTFDEAGTRDPAHKSSRRIAARGFFADIAPKMLSSDRGPLPQRVPQCGFGEGELEGARSARRVLAAYYHCLEIRR